MDIRECLANLAVCSGLIGVTEPVVREARSTPPGYGVTIPNDKPIQKLGYSLVGAGLAGHAANAVYSTRRNLKEENA